MEVATPYCYETVRFDLVEEWPLRQLVEIARNERLRVHVKRLVLQRRFGLREFGTMKRWEECLDFANLEPEQEQEGREQSDERYGIEKPMRRVDWVLLSKEEKVKLFTDFDADYERWKARERRLTANWQSRHGGRKTQEKHADSADDTDEKSASSFAGLFRQFDGAVRLLRNVAQFAHEPAYAYDAGWAMRWRCLRFNGALYALDNLFDEEEGLEALQLSFSLRALGLANYFNRNIRSLKLQIDGPAFWGADCLEPLRQGQEQLTASYSAQDNIRLRAQDAQLEARDDSYNEMLPLMKHVFSTVEYLDLILSVDEGESDYKTIYDLIFMFLSQCRPLISLKVLISELGDKLDPMLLEKVYIEDLLSQVVLARSWQNLVQLEIGFVVDDTSLLMDCLNSAAQSLRKLSLNKVQISQGCSTFESLLPKLGRVLTLDKLKLSELFDYVPHERLILKKDLWVWQRHVDLDKLVGRGYDQRTGRYTEYLYKYDEARMKRRLENVIPCFGHQEEEIVSAILNRTALPELDPLAYLRAHRHVCIEYPSPSGNDGDNGDENDPRLESERGDGLGSNAHRIGAPHAAETPPPYLDDHAWRDPEEILQEDAYYVEGLLRRMHLFGYEQED